jgi:hypothetical protein
LEKEKESEMEFKKAIDAFNKKHKAYYERHLPQILDVIRARKRCFFLLIVFLL